MRPAAIQANAIHIVPLIIHQLDLLVAAYKKEAEDGEEDEEEEEEGAGDDQVEEELDGELDDEEDDKKQRNPLLQRLGNKLGEDTDDDDDDNDPLSLAQTILEIDYQTYIDDEDNGIDEYCAMKDTLQVIQTTDSDWFALITSSLNEEMATKLQTLFVTADQRRAAMEAKKCETAGGYCFNVTAVPNAFVFSSQQ